MAETIKEQGILALKALLKTISTANGYATNIGTNVFRGKTTKLETHELPGTIIQEGDEESSDTLSMGFTHYWQELSIEARANYMDGEDWNKLAGKMQADIVKAVGTNPTLSSLVIELQPKPDQTGIDDSEHLIAGKDMTIIIHYRTRYLDPYN